MNWKNLLQVWHNELTIQDDEIKALIRQWRNQELADSDWTQVSDIDPVYVDIEAWKQYRQKLRDVLKQNSDPKLIILPKSPK